MRLIYGYEFSATLTTDRLHYKLQTRPIVREGAQDEEQSNCPAIEMRNKNLVIAPKGVPDTKTARPTDRRSHQLNSMSRTVIVILIYHRHKPIDLVSYSTQS
jgi:hypothetical protein